ncbi:copper homeostasis membrane protein CopD [Pseudomonas sp. 10B1]|uniref:copper homeostasis membrane protein CopD n=1 Tax=unclassified Pseudomonas TaxID=196821 RepID=UPI002AB4D9F2|nr:MULTISPECIES: copper homeostasis membrane protein CopD [unclassified Pseudomonas]MDY7560252.1 copper homeostasis membrane protein CopD [Pseudomonas sp. AB6]MEA9993882.1 copper homeostasis membrane protein CopD [Pseudomonas sp. AA4]MEB0085438.1 copper homeostasis membrane protein CopD [Pseudomonas sp. RTI1]MEB0124500.1 copper homeostasis membrane protein CopD [Pseudomonas sp. CCC1.2]MEB0152353.1 copper homeostasis membrane protein CopD [Pseudomonas sp. CCC4.3]
MQNALILCRFVHFAAVLFLFGSDLFRTWLFRARLERADTATLDVSLTWISRALILLALVSGVLVLMFTAASMAGSWQDGLDLNTLSLVVDQTFFGKVWCAHLLLNVALLTNVVSDRRPCPTLRMILTTLLLATLAPVGHGAMFDGLLGGLMMFNQLVHLSGVGAWLGGLLLLSLLMATQAPANAVPLLLRFSGIGYSLVGLIVTTGLINVRVMSGALWPEPALSGFGLILLIKVCLVLCMLLLALFNRVLLNHHAHRFNVLRTSVALECLFGVLAVAAVSLLGTLPPMLAI